MDASDNEETGKYSFCFVRQGMNDFPTPWLDRIYPVQWIVVATPDLQLHPFPQTLGSRIERFIPFPSRLYYIDMHFRVLIWVRFAITRPIRAVLKIVPVSGCGGQYSRSVLYTPLKCFFANLKPKSP